MTITLLYKTNRSSFLLTYAGLAVVLFISCGGGSSEYMLAKRDDGATLTLPGGVEMSFASIPAGAFQMGSPPGEKDRDDDEGPVSEVTISNPFYLSVYEVTQEQWSALMPYNPSKNQATPTHPVDSVLWEDCQRFIDKLNQLGAGRFRLPTEAEWEYACRAGTTTRYYWGTDTHFQEAQSNAWIEFNAEGQTHPVGRKPPNPWGLYDMSGNVAEWCYDWYAPYPPGPLTDPAGPEEGAVRVKRGGGVYDFPWLCRSAARNPETNPARLENYGFRVLLEP